MNNIFTKMLVVFALILSGCAQTDKKAESAWIQTVSTQDFAAYLNTSDVPRGGGLPKYWVRKEFLKPQPSSDGPDYIKDLSLYAADCKARSAAAASVVRYSKSGSVVHRTSRQPNEYKFETPAPESLEAAHIKRVCESR